MGRFKDFEKEKGGHCAPGFASDLVDPIEQDRRRSQSYVEDAAIEGRPIDDVKAGAQIATIPPDTTNFTASSTLMPHSKTSSSRKNRAKPEVGFGMVGT